MNSASLRSTSSPLTGMYLKLILWSSYQYSRSLSNSWSLSLNNCIYSRFSSNSCLLVSNSFSIDSKCFKLPECCCSRKLSSCFNKPFTCDSASRAESRCSRFKFSALKPTHIQTVKIEVTYIWLASLFHFFRPQAYLHFAWVQILSPCYPWATRHCCWLLLWALRIRSIFHQIA